MKPLVLKLQNFGPYAGPELCIDFARLDRLFLIAGDTGAGKTSLFDAISYALYGRPLGTRNAATLRSQFAAETESCVVNFTFETLAEQFQVTRSPYWVEKALRGGGFKKPTTLLAAFRRPNGAEDWQKLAEGSDSAVDTALQAAVGFSHAEFSKLVVLPQGQFQQFLEMESRDRELLLKQLFPVEDHERLAALAQERAKGLEDEERALRERQDEVRRDFDPDQAAERQALLEEELGEAQGVARAADEAHQVALAALTEGTLRQKQFQDLAKQQGLLAGLEEQAAAREQDQKRLDEDQRALQVRSILDQTEAAEQDRIRLEQDLQALQARVQGAEVRLAEARQACAGLEEARKGLEARREEARTLEGRRLRLRELAELEQDLETQRRALQGAEEDLGQAGIDHQVLLEQLVAMDQGVAVLQELRSSMDRLMAEVEPVKLLEKDAKALLELRSTGLPRLEADLKAAQAEAQRAVGKLEAAKEALRASEAARDQARAADLAAGLVHGQPCPVCGSLEHPAPALGGGGAEAELLETRRELVEACQQRVLDTGSLARVAASQLEQQKQEAGDLATGLAEAGFPGPEALLNRLNALRDDYKALSGRLKPLEKAQEGRGELQERIRASSLVQDRFRERRDSLRQDVAVRASNRERIYQEAGAPEDAAGALAELEIEARLLAESIQREGERLDGLEREVREAENDQGLAQAARSQKAQDLSALAGRLEALDGELRRALASAGFADREALRRALLGDADPQGSERRQGRPCEPGAGPAGGGGAGSGRAGIGGERYPFRPGSGQGCPACLPDGSGSSSQGGGSLGRASGGLEGPQGPGSHFPRTLQRSERRRERRATQAQLLQLRPGALAGPGSGPRQPPSLDPLRGALSIRSQ
ncbi:MAG: repair exonuclease, SbcC [Holophagaceae bacterium]|nr:repair exonuclease, SbcC [Holophagaceae bacterium]